MGRRGPPPTPTKLNELRGNPGKRVRNRREPQPTPGAPPCPRWLSAEAKAEWRRIVPELDRLGLVTLVDRTALAAYCQAHAELAQATQILEDEGRVLEVDVFNKAGEVSGSVKKLHPAVKLQRDAFARVKQFLGEFGLSPSSRTRLQTPGPPDDEDPLEKLLRGAHTDN